MADQAMQERMVEARDAIRDLLAERYTDPKGIDIELLVGASAMAVVHYLGLARQYETPKNATKLRSLVLDLLDADVRAGEPPVGTT